MNYADYLKKSNNSLTAKRYAAPKGAKGKKTWGATSHKEDYLSESDFMRNVDRLYRKKHPNYAGNKSVYICIECMKPVGIATRRKQKSKLIAGKGYSGLLCAHHLYVREQTGATS